MITEECGGREPRAETGAKARVAHEPVEGEQDGRGDGDQQRGAHTEAAAVGCRDGRSRAHRESGLGATEAEGPASAPAAHAGKLCAHRGSPVNALGRQAANRLGEQAGRAITARIAAHAPERAQGGRQPARDQEDDQRTDEEPAYLARSGVCGEGPCASVMG